VYVGGREGGKEGGREGGREVGRVTYGLDGLDVVAGSGTEGQHTEVRISLRGRREGARKGMRAERPRGQEGVEGR